MFKDNLNRDTSVIEIGSENNEEHASSLLNKYVVITALIVIVVVIVTTTVLPVPSFDAPLVPSSMPTFRPSFSPTSALSTTTLSIFALPDVVAENGGLMSLCEVEIYMCGDNVTNVINGSSYSSTPYDSGNALGVTDGVITPAIASSCLTLKESAGRTIHWIVEFGLQTRRVETVKIWGVFGSMQRLNNLLIGYSHVNHTFIERALSSSHSDAVFPDIVTYECIY